MTETYQETEVKYYVNQLGGVRQRLEELGAELIRPRVLERNLRFDTVRGELTAAHRVLRLRQDDRIRLTYKGSAVLLNGVQTRREIEFEVNDFNAAQAFLEALGYQVSMVYEKYRAVYRYEQAEIALDEMPFGNFVEIEAPSPARIQALSAALHLIWERRINLSYAALFAALCQRLHLDLRDLTFENFRNLDIQPEDLGVVPAQE